MGKGKLVWKTRSVPHCHLLSLPRTKSVGEGREWTVWKQEFLDEIRMTDIII